LLRTSDKEEREREKRERERKRERGMNTFANPMGQESPGLARSYTRSSKHELLKQIRDAVNPNQRSHNIILITQTAM